ncbi:MAG: hypothetical protein FH748_06200 [Balneolaceae bacterium]|nr:hypothetical protein [Balneolaceae bacterium]
MLWIIISASLVALISIYLGYSRLVYLDQINKRNLSISLLLILALFLVLQLLHSLGWFPQEIAAGTMTSVYASIGGFFGGAALQQFRQKSSSGPIEYVHNSFWTDIFPNVVALGLILFGIQRTSLLGDLPVTPIRFTSGCSILAVGCWGFTIRLVPEFRAKGIILIDRLISWDQLFAYSWYSEHVIEIEYLKDEKVKSFKTMVPDDDHLEIEQLLSSKMAQKIENESFDEYEEVD